MGKFITAKPSDGVDHNALTRGLGWLFSGSHSPVFIYTPGKRNAQDMANDSTMPEHLRALFKALLKSNSTTVGSITINLCFGSGAGACGNPPPHGSTARILLCYSNPKYTDWLLTRAPNADVCLLPWMGSEAASWTAAHSPTVI